MTKQTTYGTINDHDVTVTIQGPEAQSIPDGDDRLGSDVLMARVESVLAELKTEVETDTRRIYDQPDGSAIVVDEEGENE